LKLRKQDDWNNKTKWQKEFKRFKKKMSAALFDETKELMMGMSIGFACSSMPVVDCLSSQCKVSVQ